MPGPRPIVRTCCCCDLRTGAILIALFSMGIAGINIYSGINAVTTLKESKPIIKDDGTEHNLPIPWRYYDDAINVGWSNVCFFVSNIAIGIILLIAAIQQLPCLLSCWIIWSAVCLLYHLAVSIFFLSIWKGIPMFGYGLIIDVVIEIYFLIVVYSFKQQITEQQQGHGFPLGHSPMQGVVVSVPGEAVPGPYPQPYPQPYAVVPPAYPQTAPPPYVAQAPPPYSEYQQVVLTDKEKL